MTTITAIMCVKQHSIEFHMTITEYNQKNEGREEKERRVTEAYGSKKNPENVDAFHNP